MKYKVSIISILVFYLLISVTTFADSNLKNLLEQNSLENATEKNKVLKALQNEYGDISNYIETQKDSKIKKLKDNDIIKIYKPGDFNIIQQYNKDNNFANLISNDYLWEVPMYNSNKKIISSCRIVKGKKLEDLKDNGTHLPEDARKQIKRLEGKWHLGVIGNSISTSSLEFMTNFNEIEEFLTKEGIKNISQIKFVTLPSYFSYVIYIKSNNEELVIPFSEREDLTGFKNKTLYKASELINILENSFKRPNNTNSDEKQFGSVGAGSNGNQENSTNWMLFSVLVVLIMLGSIYFINKHKKAKSD